MSKVETSMNQTERQIIRRELVDSRTQQIVRTYTADQGKAARRAADRMDLQYGAVRYIVRLVLA